MPTLEPTEYEPIYVSVDSVPIEIPDDYSEDRKREALFQAETRLEIELNGGVELLEEDVTNIHRSAVANLATYHLARAATNNSDVTLGDLDDGGEQTKNHAQQYLDSYNDHIDLLAESDGKGQTGTYFGATGNQGRTVSVNTGSDSRRHNLNSRTRQIVHDRFVK